MLKYHFRVDKENNRHTHFTVFANGENCGQLVMTGEEFWGIIAACMGDPVDAKFRVTWDFDVLRDSALPHSPASDSCPEGPREDERTGDGRGNEQ